MRHGKILLTAFLSCTMLTLTCCRRGGTYLQASAQDIQPAEKKIDLLNAKARHELLKKYLYDDCVNQILFVSHTENSSAKVRFYVKQNEKWNLKLKTEAYVGENGMGKSKEGDKKTPLGVYEIKSAFGIRKNPGTVLDYIRIKPSTFACNEDCEYYNCIIDAESTGHECHGEEMYRISPEYDYGLVVGYNSENIFPAGSAIFVHCKGEKSFTSGCIAIDENEMISVLKSSAEGMMICLDEYYVNE